MVSRGWLLESLNQGLHRKLTLISAGAGYGKTTLLSEWAAQCDYPLAWVTLASGDNDTERFLAYLISALQTLNTSFSRLDGLLGTRFSLQPIPLDATLAVLVNELSTTAEKLVIVLDDYQHIENPEIHGFLSAFLENLPLNIHLIIATRSEPPLKLARLRAKDQLNEITEKHLRFTLQETHAFIDAVMGLKLTDDQVSELESRTEGWVTGLQLVGLSLKDRKHPGELISTLAGTHRYILDYLVEEVFTDLPALLQTFLLRVSILDRLSPELCDAVVADSLNDSNAQTQSKKILEFMESSNLFVVPLDNQRQWYRFHPLFAEFLQNRLESRYKDLLPTLHRRAAAWYAGNDLIAEAVQHYIAGGDVENAADLIQSQAKELLGRGEISTLMRWIEALPEDTVRLRPHLGLARAWGMMMREPLAFWNTSEEQIEQIAKGLGIAVDELLRVLPESKPDSAQRAALGEFAMLLAFIQRDTKDVEVTIKLFKSALEYLPESELLLRGFCLAGLASTFARMGAIQSAEKAFAKAAQLSVAAKSTYGYVACTDWQATMQAEQGKLRRAEETYQRAIGVLAGEDQRPLPLSGHVYIGLADVLLEWNDLEKSLESIRIGLQIGTQVRDYDALLAGYPLQAHAFQATHRNDDALAAIRKAEQLALETENTSCLQDAQANKAQIALYAGNVEEAQRWATERGLTQGNLSDTEHPFAEVEYISFVRLLMETGKASQALPILKELLSTQEKMGRGRAAIETMALLALCYRSLGRMDEATRTLARALLLAEPEGFVRVFIREGTAMAALLRAAGAHGHAPNYVKHLLEAFGESGALQGSLLDPLSERELQVLALVAQGLTNAEIAAELVIAHSTVKTHINRIYSKLDVSNRTQAVVRARQLQILE